MLTLFVLIGMSDTSCDRDKIVNRLMIIPLTAAIAADYFIWR